MDYSSPFAMRARAVGRRLGILQPIVGYYRRLLSKSYEQRFRESLLSAIRPGDVVWDIGANVGVYTALFADCVGPSGMVVAFEPSPISYEALGAAVGDRSNVRLHNVALSHESRRSNFYVSDLAATDGLTRHSDQSRAIEVSVERGDSFRSSGSPNVVKIDVEGLELGVLKGMSALLADPALRAIFVEVHFMVLENLGLRTAPAEMVALLREAGFEVWWIDPSHFGAARI